MLKLARSSTPARPMLSWPVIRCARSSGLHLVELVASVASHLRFPELLLLVPVLA